MHRLLVPRQSILQLIIAGGISWWLAKIFKQRLA
jgi:hypothetical protein